MDWEDIINATAVIVLMGLLILASLTVLSMHTADMRKLDLEEMRINCEKPHD